MRFHYFEDEKAPLEDIQLQMAVNQGYVPSTCLLAGFIVLGEVRDRKDPCAGCNGPREKCHGRPKLDS